MITWRDAARPDRTLLQGLECTIDFERGAHGRTLYHGRPWEREVQSYLRERTPPSGPNERLRLGIEGEALVAAYEVSRLTIPEGVLVKILALAVSVDCRGLGGEVADLLIEDALYQSLNLGAETNSEGVLVLASVSPHNEPGRALLLRNGFAFRELRNEYEDWVIVVRA